MTVQDVAKLLDVSAKTVYRWAGQGRLPARRVNDQYRFNRAEILEWATAQRLPVSPLIFQEEEQAAGPLPTVLEAVKAGGIVYRVEGKNQDAVLRSVVEQLKLPDEVDREFLYQVLLARENLGSTGIGDGIALPHVRNPVVLHVNRPTITVCFLEQPVDFKAIDGKPVTTLFTMISPTVRAHLHLLSRLGFMLRNPQLKQALGNQILREELLQLLASVEAGIPAR